MILQYSSFVSLSALFSFVVAQSDSTPLFDPTMCIPGSGVTFTACNDFNSRLDNCTVQATNQGLTDCMCSQAYFNVMVDCESEFRLCTGDTSWDSTMEGQISVWHGYCDSVASVRPTTPVLSSTRANGQAITSASITATPTMSPSVTVSRADGSGTSTSSSAAGNKLERPQGLAAGLGVIPLLLLALHL